MDIKILKKTLVYFEKVYNISEFINTKVIQKSGNGNIESEISIASFPMVIIFFSEVLDYYSNHSIPIDYINIKEKSEIKISIIQKIFPNYTNTMQMIKMYDMLDFIFKNFKILITNCDIGLKKTDGKFTFNQILNDIDLLLYITFMNVFPSELNLKLKESLKISYNESEIISKCNSIIIEKNEKICEYNINTNKKIKYIKLNTKEGIYIMFSILLNLRKFKDRRPSKQI